MNAKRPNRCITLRKEVHVKFELIHTCHAMDTSRLQIEDKTCTSGFTLCNLLNIRIILVWRIMRYLNMFLLLKFSSFWMYWKVEICILAIACNWINKFYFISTCRYELVFSTKLVMYLCTRGVQIYCKLYIQWHSPCAGYWALKN